MGDGHPMAINVFINVLFIYKYNYKSNNDPNSNNPSSKNKGPFEKKKVCTENTLKTME